MLVSGLLMPAILSSLLTPAVMTKCSKKKNEVKTRVKLRRESDYSDGARKAVARTVNMAATRWRWAVDETHDVLFLAPSWHETCPVWP